MSVFSIAVNKDFSLVSQFFEDTRQRLKTGKVPFTGGIAGPYQEEKRDIYVLVLSPVYPQVYFIGYILLAALLFLQVFGGLTGPILNWGTLIGAVMGATILLWSSTFHKWILRRGLKKAGYTGTVESFNNQEFEALLTAHVI